MAVGSHGYFTPTGGPTEPGTTFEDFDPTWSETEDPDAIYSVVSGNIRVAEAGRYFVRYSFLFGATGNGRHNLITRLRKNTTVIEGSQGCSFARNTANSNERMVGHCIVDMAANDDIDIQWKRHSDSETGTINGASSEIQLVRLTDSADTAYAHYSDGADASADGGTTYNNIPWDTIEEETNTAVIQRNGAGPGVNQKGASGDRFLVLYSVHYNNSSNNRTQRVSRATLAGTEIKATHSYDYMRDDANGEGNVKAAFIVEKASASDEELLIQVRRGATGEADVDGTVTRQTNQSGLFIMKLLSTTEVCGFHDPTGGEDIGGTFIDIDCVDTETFRDSASFTRLNAEQIEVEKANVYLFMANCKAVRSGTSGTRMLSELRWEKNTALVTPGRDINYLRGNQGNTDTYGFSWNTHLIIDLAVNDDIGYRSTDIGDNGSTDLTTANEVGIFAINLGTLAPGGAVEKSKTFDIDALVKAEDQTKTFDIDALVQAVDNQKTFDIDAIVKALDQSKVFDTDAIVKALDQSKVFDIDAFVKALDTEKTFDIDAIVVNPRTKTFDIDALLKALDQTKTFDIDVFVKALDQSKTFDIDTFVKALDQTKAFDIDAFVKALDQSKTFDIDAIMALADQQKTFDIDAIVKAIDSIKAFDIDAIVVNPRTKTFTIDALVKALDQTKTFDIDALVQAVDQQKTFDIDAIMVKEQSKTFDIDAIIKALDNQKTFTINAFVQAIDQQKTFDIDAILIKEQSKTFTIDAIIKALDTEKTFDIDALVKSLDTQKVFDIDALIQALDQQKTFDIDALLVNADLTKTFDIDALVQAIDNQKTFDIDALVQAQDQQKTFDIDSILIEESKTKTFTIDAFVKALDAQKTFDIDAILIIPGGGAYGQQAAFEPFKRPKLRQLFRIPSTALASLSFQEVSKAKSKIKKRLKSRAKAVYVFKFPSKSQSKINIRLTSLTKSTIPLKLITNSSKSLITAAQGSAKSPILKQIKGKAVSNLNFTGMKLEELKELLKRFDELDNLD